jgi:hypothetical protein
MPEANEDGKTSQFWMGPWMSTDEDAPGQLGFEIWMFAEFEDLFDSLWFVHEVFATDQHFFVRLDPRADPKIAEAEIMKIVEEKLNALDSEEIITAVREFLCNQENSTTDTTD